jgi:hypothetical protein
MLLPSLLALLAALLPLPLPHRSQKSEQRNQKVSAPSSLSQRHSILIRKRTRFQGQMTMKTAIQMMVNQVRLDYLLGNRANRQCHVFCKANASSSNVGFKKIAKMAKWSMLVGSEMAARRGRE